MVNGFLFAILIMDFEMIQEKGEQSPNKCLQDTFTDNYFAPVLHSQASYQEAHVIVELQSLLKSEYLLLEYEEKRKNDRVKEIECVYTNGYKNYLWEKNRKKGGSPTEIINRKDMLQLDESLPEELEVFRKCVLKVKMNEIFNFNSKPNPSFLRDFFNFYPSWPHHISTIIGMEVDNAPQIENVFESEYTFPAKVLSSLKLSSSIELFCAEIFVKPLKEIINYNSELSLDFYHLYEPWMKRIKASAEKGPLHEMHKFMMQESKPDSKQMKKLKEEVAELIGKKSAEAEKLIGQMSYFSENKEAIKHLFSEIGEDEVDESGLNIKLAVLVWKKILDHRRKIESILTAFIEQILSSYAIFPKEVKFIMKEYHRLAKNKFKEVKYEDVKSFFNKVIYSQLLLPEFMRLLDEENGVDKNVKNFNIPILALFSQKILYGQEFYEKQKYSYFNQLITHYAAPIKRFMMNFLDDINMEPPSSSLRQIEPMLLSFDAIKYLYDNMRANDKVPVLNALSSKISNNSEFQFGSSKYKAKDVYIIFINGHDHNYQEVFRPKQKIKRIFIEFLMLIDKIPQPAHLSILIEQYKYAASNSELQSVELHANYLSLIQEELNIVELCHEIERDVKGVKVICERTKIELEKEHNLAQNFEKVYMKKLNEKQKFNAFITIKSYIDCLLAAPAGFGYGVFNNKVCEVEVEGATNTLGKCLSDVADYYVKGYEGFDALYHWMQEKMNEEIESQGIVDEATLNAANIIVGTKLYELIRLSTATSEKDHRILEQMKKHSFVNLQLLELSQYSDEEELIVDLALPLLEKIKVPQAPHELLKIFYEVTLIFQNIILTTGKASDITADVQIPLMILILIKSRLPNLSSVLNFIEKFANDDINSSVLGQTLTLMSSVCYLIEQMGPKQLNLPEQKYNELCQQQFSRMKAEHDRQYMIIDTD